MAKRAIAAEPTSVGDPVLVDAFRRLVPEGYPDIHALARTLDRALWVLLVAKEKLNRRALDVSQIVAVLVNALDISMRPKAVVMALNRAGGKVHTNKRGPGNRTTTYAVMDEGRKYLLGMAGSAVAVWHFSPGQKYSSKNILVEQVLTKLKGELRIVDTYCGSRTLDLLRRVSDSQVRLVTTMATTNRKASEVEALRRDMRDYHSEFPHTDFRDLHGVGLHDRYVLADDCIVLLGHGLKDLGGKESFVIVLPKPVCPDLHAALGDSFEQRWQSALPII